MTIQPNLPFIDDRVEPRYAETLPESLKRMSRRGNPVSSKDAAETAVSSGSVGSHEEMILRALRRRDGQTGHELAVATGLNQVEVIRRCSGMAASRSILLNGQQKVLPPRVRKADSNVPCLVKPKSKQCRWWLT